MRDTNQSNVLFQNQNGICIRCYIGLDSQLFGHVVFWSIFEIKGSNEIDL